MAKDGFRPPGLNRVKFSAPFEKYFVPLNSVNFLSFYTLAFYQSI